MVVVGERQPQRVESFDSKVHHFTFGAGFGSRPFFGACFCGGVASIRFTILSRHSAVGSSFMEPDMPHPYHGSEEPVFGPDALLQRPSLAAYIGAIATLDETIQEAWGVVLACALTSDARMGTELYLSLTGSNAQATVLRKAIEIATKDEPAAQAVYASLSKSQKGRSDERNRIVHGKWGILPSREDVLILGERNWITKAIADLNHYYEREWQPGDEFLAPTPVFDRQTYTKKDFENVLSRLHAFHQQQHLLIDTLRELHLQRREKQRQLKDLKERGLLTAPLLDPPTRPETTLKVF